jgi:peptide/nickel transport system substrate-binding protein
MRKKRLVAITAAISAVVLAAAACGSGSGSTAGDSAAGYNAADTSIVNPQSGVGGTLKLEMSTTVDTLDSGVTYEGVTWDLYQLFDRTMMSYAPEPGSAGLKLVNDLVTSWSSSNDNRSWTYHIENGAKFSDGDTITTADVAYAIERSNFDSTQTVYGGPGYFANLIQNDNNYQGPYKSPGEQVSGILTPNATTITFNLNQPFADFNYLMTLLQTSPIEPSHDPRADYSTDVSKDSFTGQYEVQSFSLSSTNPGMVLVPNPYFDESTDPSHVHVRHASKIVITEGVNPTTVDQDVLAGKTNLDIRGIGVQDATQNLVLSNPKYRADADDAETGAESFVQINTQVEPFNNINCREAVEWAINKQEIQDVSGGVVGGGQIATTILPPNNSGYKASDQYATGGEEGDIPKATALVNTCKEQEGSSFDGSFNLATYLPSDNPKFAADANVIIQNLNQIGFNVSLDEWGYSTNPGFFATYAGDESYADSHRVGLSLWAWTADFPTGYGYMDELLTSAGISSTGDSYDLSYWNSTTFDNLLNSALAAPTQAQTDADYAAADSYAMSQAVLVPLLYETSLYYRPPTTTNVMFGEAYGMYDYGMLGTTATN